MPPATVEQILHRLASFWEERGSGLLPPCELPVGFGLAAPEVFLSLFDGRARTTHQLVAVHRPVDARYGRSSLRMTRHLRFQLVRQPVSAGVRHEVLDSFRAAGFELDRRDVRFVEGTTSRPEIGVRGRHQRVLIDGLPVARMVFVERAAGVRLPLSCLEVSYGIERLASVQQGHADLFRIDWGGGHATARSEAEGSSAWMEEERSRYLLEVADVELLRSQLESFDQQASRCLEAGLVLPAYESALRSLQVLEVLKLRSLPLLADHDLLFGRIRRRVERCVQLRARRQGLDPDTRSGAHALGVADDPDDRQLELTAEER
ncbi:MAG: glycine--tRNA ligase subunit alpha [Acidobacteria bacterium]|nr:MAG: glycine--tRNA ligase subunit alpha [Acidobacteriota bacterium]REK01075.1 MAG: glycine--tRNA ligase subunit alpha [Acidobacteriota bacterium]